MHFRESLVMETGYITLKAFYEDIAEGVRFLPPDEIQTRKICRALKRWLGDETVSNLNVIDATEGEINAWQDTIRVSLNIDWSSMILVLRRAREAVDSSLCTVFRQWQGDRQLKFDDWVREETFGVGKGLIVSFGNTFDAVKQQPDDVDAFLRFTHHPMHRILRDLREGGTPAHEEYERLCEFFRSAVFSDLPSVNLSALMFAAVARQAAHQGRTNPPNRGFSTDVSVISAFLPYCDAMFIDKDCWTILTQNPVRDRLGFSKKLFSALNAEEFVKYLQAIGGSVSSEHRDALREVYGDGLADKLRELGDA